MRLPLPPAALAREAGCARVSLYLCLRRPLPGRQAARASLSIFASGGPCQGGRLRAHLSLSLPPAALAREAAARIFINGARWGCAPSRASRASPSGQDPPEALLHQRGSPGLRPISRVARQPVRPGPAGGTSSSTGLAGAAPHLARRAPARPAKTRRRHFFISGARWGAAAEGGDRVIKVLVSTRLLRIFLFYKNKGKAEIRFLSITENGI